MTAWLVNALENGNAAVLVSLLAVLVTGGLCLASVVLRGHVRRNPQYQKDTETQQDVPIHL